MKGASNAEGEAPCDKLQDSRGKSEVKKIPDDNINNNQHSAIWDVTRSAEVSQKQMNGYLRQRQRWTWKWESLYVS